MTGSIAAKGCRGLVGALVAAMVVGLCTVAAEAQTTPGWASNPYPGMFDIATPGRFSLTLFGGGFLSDQYATTQEGVQAEQSVTQYLGVVARATGYQLYMGHGFANPLLPNPPTGVGGASRYNFGRFQGGIDFAVTPTTHLYVLGGMTLGTAITQTLKVTFRVGCWSIPLTQSISWSVRSIAGKT